MEYFAERFLVAALGAFFLLAARHQARRVVRLRRVGIRTTAQVVSPEKAEEGYGTLIVAYADRSGGRHRVRISDYYGLPIGPTVEIVYDPDEPGVPSGSDFGPAWLVTIFLACLGAMFVMIAWSWGGDVGSGA